jgi:hypothetical protein
MLPSICSLFAPDQTDANADATAAVALLLHCYRPAAAVSTAADANADAAAAVTLLLHYYSPAAAVSTTDANS